MRRLILLTVLSTVAVFRITSILSLPCIKDGKEVEIRPYGVPGETFLFVKHLRCKNSELDKIKHKELHSQFQKFKNGGALLAMVSGDRSLISMETWERWRKSGVGHLLVISGQQLALLAMIILWLFIPIERIFPFFSARYELSRWNGVIILPLIWGYVFWTGSDGATIRSGMMLTVFFFYRAFYLRFALWQWFLLTILLILCVFPAVLVDTGFHLSLFAVFGIILANKNFPSKNIIMRWSITTLGATFGVFPICAFYFGEFALFGWLSSLIAAPLIIFVLPAVSVATFLITLNIHYVPEMILAISDWLISVFENLILNPIANHRIAMISIPVNGLLSLLIVLIAAISLYCSIKKRKFRNALLAPLLGIIILFSLPKLFWILTKKSSTLQWTTISVGQGESLLFRFPTGESMLIDGGGHFNNKFDPGGSLVIPAVNHFGVNKIDLLVVSHPDIDHLKGLFAVVRRKSIGKIWINDFPVASDALVKFLAEARIRNIPAVIDPSGTINYANVRIEVIKGYGKYDSTNNRSMVLKISYGKHSFLLTGDIEAARERSVLQSNADIDVDILKIPHHGSKTSSVAEFLYEVSPKLGIISAGYKNRYNHPHPSVTERLKDQKIPYLLTATHGSIQIETDGETIETRCFDGYKRRWMRCL